LVLFSLSALAVLVACSSDDASTDDGTAGGGDGGSLASAEAGADAGADARAPADARADAPAIDAAIGQTFSGEATYYAADGTGACGFKATPNDLMVAAMNKAQYKKSLCGQCIAVTGPKGTVKVRIVDLCPGCSMGDVDLSKQAFAAIAALSAGRIDITWNFVPCT